MLIQHNISALNTFRSLTLNHQSLSRTLEGLASGYRVNSAADDAAGLAISEKMRSQITGLAQASKNTVDGISLLQVADGGLQEVHTILQRMNELAVQGSNGIYDNQDRSALQSEIETLKAEVDRISSSLSFNGIQLFDGSKSRLGTPIGGSSTKKVLTEKQLASIIQKALSDINETQNPEKTGLLIYDYFGFNTTQSASGPTVTDPKWNALKNDLAGRILPNIVSSMLDSFSAFDYLKGSSIGIGLNFYNDPNPSNADASIYSQWRQEGPDKQPTLAFTLNINTARNYFNPEGSFAVGKKEQFEALMCHEMMHAFMVEATTNGMLLAPANDRFPLWFKEGMAQAAGGDLNWLNTPSGNSPALSASSSGADILKVMSNLGKSDSMSVYKTGYLATLYLGHLIAGSTSGAGTEGTAPFQASSILGGLNTLMNDVIGGKSLNQTIKDHTKYNSLEDFRKAVSDGTAPNMAPFVQDLLAEIASGGPGALGSLITGDFKAKDIVSESPPSVIDLFELNKDYSLVTNSYPNDVTVNSGGSLNNNGTPPGTEFVPGAPSPGPWPQNGAITLQVGPSSAETVAIYLEDMSSQALGLNDVLLDSVTSSQQSIGRVNTAIGKVSEMRGDIGGWHRRLEHITHNLNITENNMTAAESRIRDMDMAKGMMSFTKNQVIVQAAQAMLAHSNNQPQQILSLLRS